MRVIGITPAGRRRYIEILVPYLLKAKCVLNEHHFWVNTDNSDDIEFLVALANKHPDFFKLKYSVMNYHKPGANFFSENIHSFFKHATDNDAIYIRLDDDICWVADDAIANLAKFRLDNPHPFLVSGNIVNNSICNHIHQRMGILDTLHGYCTYDPLCEFSLGDTKSPELAHNALLERIAEPTRLTDYKFLQWCLYEYTRISINCISWFGRDMPTVDKDEELFLSSIYPASIKRLNVICGTALVSHFAYGRQRASLEANTNLLEKYRALSLRE